MLHPPQKKLQMVKEEELCATERGPLLTGSFPHEAQRLEAGTGVIHIQTVLLNVHVGKTTHAPDLLH